MLSDMDNLGSGIDRLPAVREGHRGMGRGAPISDEHTAGIEHRDSGSEISSDPFYRTVFLHERSLRVEIVGVFAPVLHGRIP